MARGAAAAGAVNCLSTLATATIEEVAAAAPEAARWFQLYWSRDRDVVRDLVERAAAAGYGAVVVTVDLPALGRRERDLRTGFEIPEDIPVPAFLALAKGASMTPADINSMVDNSLTWRDLEWLRSVTSLPLLVKGILTAEDAALAVEAESRASSSRTTAAASSTAPRPRSMRCRRSSRRPATRPRCCSTAASAVAPMSSRRSRWAPAPCSWDARRSTGSRSEAPTASSGCSASCARRSSSLLRSAAARPPPRSRAGTLPGPEGDPVLYEPEAFEPLTDEPWDARSCGRPDTHDRRRRRRGLRSGHALAGRRVGRLGGDGSDEGPLRGGFRRRLGTRRVAQARPRGDDARPRLGCAAHPRSLARDARLRAMG